MITYRGAAEATRKACAKVARDAQADWVAISAPIQAATAERIADAIESLPIDDLPSGSCGKPVSGGRNCGDTTVATGKPITIICGRCRTGRPPIDGTAK